MSKDKIYPNITVEEAIKLAQDIIVYGLGPLFPPQNPITFIVRDPDDINSTLVISNDDYEKCLQALKHHVDTAKTKKLAMSKVFRDVNGKIEEEDVTPS